MTFQVRAQQHDTLELLCYRHLGTTTGVVEQALELNRNTLGDQATLQHGQLVTLRILNLSTPTDSVINLWD